MKQIEVKNVRRELQGQLKALQSGDMAPLWEQVGPVLRGAFEANFATTASPHGGTWPARKDNLPHPLLRKTLTLYSAVTDAGASGHVADYQRREMAEGVDSSIVVYAAAQNFGYDYGDRILPARQFIDVSQGTVVNIDPMVADYGLKLMGAGA